MIHPNCRFLATKQSMESNWSQSQVWSLWICEQISVFSMRHLWTNLKELFYICTTHIRCRISSGHLTADWRRWYFSVQFDWKIDELSLQLDFQSQTVNGEHYCHCACFIKGNADDYFVRISVWISNRIDTLTSLLAWLCLGKKTDIIANSLQPNL